MQDIKLRPATATDLPAVMTIIADARALLKKQGIPQWQAEYPAAADINADIAVGTGRVLLVDSEIAGYANLDDAAEPVYDNLQDAHWQRQHPYSTIHRVALGAAFQGKHLSVPFMQALIDEAAKDHDSVRVDTQITNQVMQHILAKLGFQKRGTVKWDFEEPVVECYVYELVLR
ncbi:GNAT family N-acetyltransferase [Lacticaseibacillus zhaodongensis]|uniref:GNAT family N-acetyltransferase n=1 Tax=Lacticaseibacillus zhaodongensis TaxID=2668065 RepID=UPI0012D30AD9|nr:GNAT family protein [Lacticaseibacillus zhaodongensis]